MCATNPDRMKIICVGRNYAAHAAELGNEVPEDPILFMKPPSALLVNNKPLYYPEFTSDLHYEGELVLRICKNGKYIAPEFAAGYYTEIGFGFDFTARDLQAACKKAGRPWEIAKGFDNSAALSKFIPLDSLANPDGISFRTVLNGKVVQEGNTRDLIFSFEQVISYASRYFKIQTGDLVFTGTPSGVGPVQIGDVLEGYIEDRKMIRCEIR